MVHNVATNQTEMLDEQFFNGQEDTLTFYPNCVQMTSGKSVHALIILGILSLSWAHVHVYYMALQHVTATLDHKTTFVGSYMNLSSYTTTDHFGVFVSCGFHENVSFFFQTFVKLFDYLTGTNLCTEN